jgi:hypothetical protein
MLEQLDFTQDFLQPLMVVADRYTLACIVPQRDTV